MTKNNEESRLIKHEWWQITVVTVTVFGLFLWQQSESRADYRHLVSITESIKQDAKEFREMWAQETKEFHGRLCAIEEKNKE